jgi:hypothetical protein
MPQISDEVIEQRDAPLIAARVSHNRGRSVKARVRVANVAIGT